MRILIDIIHPAHVHFFKNAIQLWQDNDHEIIIAVRDKDIAIQLLDCCGFSYTILGKAKSGLVGLGLELVQRGTVLFREVIKSKPDLLVGVAGTFIAPVAKLAGIPCIIFYDTEIATLSNAIAFPLATAICTPACYKGNVGRKQVRYEGYQELAYLHPSYFSPNPSTLREAGLVEGEDYIVLRLVSWGAGHDFGHHGFTDLRGMVEFLGKYGKVLISSERELGEDIGGHSIAASPEKIHDLLYYAKMYVGESATMASESAMLGTPAIFVSTSRRGYTDELEERYGLVYNFSDPHTGQTEALGKAQGLLEDPNLKQEWQIRRHKMLREKIDVTQFVVDFIERYPESRRELAQG